MPEQYIAMIGDVVSAKVSADGHREPARVVKLLADGWCRVRFLNDRSRGTDGTMNGLQREFDWERHESDLQLVSRRTFEYKKKGV